ncbi:MULTISPECIES: hypothetical protein [unclassified Dyella]|uniref:hypothetical protein n=1 Tax=unclassified Dyella TaxID=2634549 RepID=UPI0011AFCCFB|nr:MULTISPECIES: hypothetical protein [unclassified Dyella]MDR3446533.1 hypothetical protein [Dyella sp.]
MSDEEALDGTIWEASCIEAKPTMLMLALYRVLTWHGRNPMFPKSLVLMAAVTVLITLPSIARSDQSPVIVNAQQAGKLARKAIAQYGNSTPVSPDDCYSLAVDKKKDGNYAVRVSERPGKTCEIIDYDRPFRPFTIEIDAIRGSAVVVGYPGQRAAPREVKLFPLESVPGFPIAGPLDPMKWTLEGDASHLAHVHQCSLSMSMPAFERWNAYSFGLMATRESRTLTMSYYVNAVSRLTLATDARVDLVFGTGRATLATYPVTFKPIYPFGEGRPVSTNDVSFQAVLDEKAARAFVGVLGRTSQMELSIDGKSQNDLGLLGQDFERAGGGRNANDTAAAALGRCLDVIWK